MPAHARKRSRKARCRRPQYDEPATGSVDKLSGWICDYMELTPEEWGGHYFTDAGLVEARKDSTGAWVEVDD